MQNTKCRTDDRCSRRLIRLIICITVAPALALLPAAQASVIVSPRIPWVAGHTADDLPEIFRGRAQERILAEKVAFIMASAALLERVLGLAVDAETIISDLQLQSQTIRLLLDEKIRTREMDVRYGEDGMVEVAAATTVAQVAEALESAEDGLEVPGLRAQQREIVAVGRAALPKSPAFAKVRAMRVAEADCYERIAARVSGMEIAQETTVRQFALASQKIRSMVAAQLLSGVRFTDYKFAEDGTCTVRVYSMSARSLPCLPTPETATVRRQISIFAKSASSPRQPAMSR